MDIETFKSFISMSINDFKNFISLTNEEKKILLDKLFNLEVINILNNILKEINKDNKTRMAILDSEIRTLEESISSMQISIKKSIEKEKLNTEQELGELVSLVESKKSDYITIKEKVEKVKDKEQILKKEIDIENRQLINIQNDVKNSNREISLYDSGKCPTCSTDFNTDHFLNLRSLLVEKRDGHNLLLEEVKTNISNIKAKQVKLRSIGDKINSSFSDINYLLRSYKSKIDELKSKSKDKKDSVNVEEFEKTISEMDEKKNNSHTKISDCKEKELYYKELNRILSEGGVKKSIISGIIKPINHFIDENVKKIEITFCC